jgi:hypothetical protein
MWVHVAMTALSLVILGVLVLWQVRQGGDDSGAPVAESTLQSSRDTAAAPEGGLLATTRMAAPRVYIVETPEEAKALSASIEQMNDFRRFEGLSPLDETVEWFVSAEDEANFWQGINAVIGVPEMTSLSVVDLRWQPAAGGTETQCLLIYLGCDEHSMALVAATDEETAEIRAGQSRPGVTVIDLRHLADGSESTIR